jgi:hypothetical protein
MAAIPELAPSDEEHILSSTSVIQEAVYAPLPDKWYMDWLGKTDMKTIRIFYRTFDTTGTEQLRLSKKPSAVLLNQKPATELKELTVQGFNWKPLNKGGILTVMRQKSNNVIVVE